uniref:Major facilitator superfamily (MFS) profile domain-containing protein n=1 Tax=Acrobeloides nanus TaxID=290746 RepID=A0A914CWT7_9BILA
MPKADKKCILKEEQTSIDEQTTDWASIYVASVLSFVGSAQFSIYFSSLWPYLQILDSSANETFFGYIIAIYSLGQIFSSPTFGYWSNRIKQVRLPLFSGLALMFIGNALYIVLELVTFPRKYLMLVCRCITGMGSGNVSLLRTYASTASTDKDRPKAIAYVTCGQALGTTAGPALQLLFTPLSYPGFQIFDMLTINMYTAPAYLACSMNFLGALALYFLFKENYAGIVDEEDNEQQPENKKSMPVRIPPYDVIAVLVCYATRFTQMFINTNLETIGSPFAMMMFAWTETKAVTFTAAAQGAVGVFTFLTYLMYILLKMDKYLNCRVSCMISLAALILFHLVTYSWPFIPGNVVLHKNTEIYNFTEQHVGCNMDKFSWCESLRPVNVYVYYVAYIVVIGLAFPTLNITLTTLFSKILGPRRQGTQQGVLQMSGSVARMVGPILISILYSAYGPRMAWHMEIIIISITLLLWCFFYGRMVPLRSVLQLDTIRVENGKAEGGIISVKSNGRIHPSGDEDKPTTTTSTTVTA